MKRHLLISEVARNINLWPDKHRWYSIFIINHIGNFWKVDFQYLGNLSMTPAIGINLSAMNV